MGQQKQNNLNIYNVALKKKKKKRKTPRDIIILCLCTKNSDDMILKYRASQMTLFLLAL